MLCATTTLAARIERAEHETARTYTEMVSGKRTEAFIRPIGGTAALYSGRDEPSNKLVGLGFGEPLDEAALAAIEAEFDARHAALRVEFATLADPAVSRTLTRRGYELIGFENVLGKALAIEDDQPSPGIEVTRVDRSGARNWIDTVVEGFVHPDAFDGPPPTESFSRETLVNVLKDYCAAPDMRLYVARRSGQIAGGGSIRVIDGIAMMTGASTLPAHRRRGVQSALLRARLSDAARSGCDLAVVTTEPASKSQQNVMKMGFELLYSRAILVRPVGA